LITSTCIGNVICPYVTTSTNNCDNIIRHLARSLVSQVTSCDEKAQTITCRWDPHISPILLYSAYFTIPHPLNNFIHGFSKRDYGRTAYYGSHAQMTGLRIIVPPGSMEYNTEHDMFRVEMRFNNIPHHIWEPVAQARWLVPGMLTVRRLRTA
jgi:hypothetical protein